MLNHRNLIFAASCIAASLSHAFASGPSNEKAWLKPMNNAWIVQPLLNVGEAAGKSGYRLAGIPDGLGAMDNGDGTISIFMNHEFPADMGIVRRHGAAGAFVSHWILETSSLKILSGEDWIHTVYLWDTASHQYAETHANSFNRLCSADLAQPAAFYNEATGSGFDGRLFLNGEEDRNGGRAFAHIVTGKDAGTSFELPHLGKLAWENAVANPATGDRTVVMGMDDSPGGQVYVYIGEKRASGNPVERAGLVGGSLYVIKVSGNRFYLAKLGDVSGMSGGDLEKASQAAGATSFLRPEDGTWDTKNANVFYFSTTDKIDGTSQLFRLIFDNIMQPEDGGAIDVALKARDIGAQMFDNLTMDGDGNLLVEEDPGDDPHMASIWQFDPASGKTAKVCTVAPEEFLDKNSPEFLTQDEENSGIIEITHLLGNAPWRQAGQRYYLGVLQVHAPANNPELLENGQLYLMSGPSASRK